MPLRAAGPQPSIAAATYGGRPRPHSDVRRAAFRYRQQLSRRTANTGVSSGGFPPSFWPRLSRTTTDPAPSNLEDFPSRPGSRMRATATAWSSRHPAAGRLEHDQDKEAEREGTAAGQAAHHSAAGHDRSQRCTRARPPRRSRRSRSLSPSTSSIRPHSGGRRGLRRSARRDQARVRRSHRTSASSLGKGIGRLAERLIVEHPGWTYRHIAEEVNAQIEGARASEKSVRWYASRMRRQGGDIANRGKTQTDPRRGIHVIVGIVRAACFTVFYRNHSQ